MRSFHHLVAFLATAGGLTLAFPASTKRESGSDPEAPVTKSLNPRGNDDPIYPNPFLNPIFLYLVAQHLLIGDAIFGVELAEVPAPAPPPARVIDTGLGVGTIVNSIQIRATNSIGGRVNTVTQFLVDGRPVVVQLSMEPVGALTWNHIVGVAGGVQNISQFIQDSVTTAINNGSQDESFALNVVTNANTGQGVQVAVFRFQLRQPQ